MEQLETAICDLKRKIKDAQIISVVFCPNSGKMITFFIDTDKKELLNKYKKMLVKCAKKMNADVIISVKGNYILFIFDDKKTTAKVREALK